MAAASHRVQRDSGQMTDQPGEDRRKHLDHIQAVIIRMSAASSTAKGWLLPVVTAAYGYAATKNAGPIALLGLAAVVLFAFLDANYLGQERAFRRLYAAVSRSEVPSYSMNPADAEEEQPAQWYYWLLWPFRFVLGPWVPRPKVWLSWSIAPFYGTLLGVGLYIYCHVN
jgi:hypothetical protein